LVFYRAAGNVLPAASVPNQPAVCGVCINVNGVSNPTFVCIAMVTNISVLPFVLAVLLLVSCKPDDDPALPDETPYVLTVPAGFPPLPAPDDNQLTVARVALGKKLFYDPVLSVDSTVACAACHRQQLAFSDAVPISPGVAGRLGFRNSPTLANVGYLPLLLKDGGVETLEIQVLTPLTDHNEMDFDIGAAAKRLMHHPNYVQMSRLAYGQDPSPSVIVKALAAFQRTLISGNAPADSPDTLAALTEAQRRGKQLFFGNTAGCGQCHNGFNYTNNAFINNGLYEVYDDPGRFRLTQNPSDVGAFRVPTLRNIALTAPYMHNGSLPTLEAVLDHYQSGGKQHPNKSPLIQAFVLTPQQRQDLIAFLQALTDTNFVNNPQFR